MTRTRDPKNEITRRNLRAFREFAGLTQEEASRISGVSVDNLRRYENGKVGAPGSAVRMLAPVYGHTMEDFYLEDPPPANLAARDGIHLWFVPGVEVDEKLRDHLMSEIRKANEMTRTKKLAAKSKKVK